jgi:hypothetical protein
VIWKIVAYVVLSPIFLMEWVGRKICEALEPKPVDWLGKLECEIKMKGGDDGQ